MKTNFKAGGLHIERHVVSEDPRMNLMAPQNFSVPEYIDSRPYCLSASNQGSMPHCAGYATAGYIEVQEWKKTGIASQVDGDKIYRKAKEIDGSLESGTSLTAAITGAEMLGYLGAGLRQRTITTKRDVQFALHKHGVCIAGFQITRGWNDTSAKTGFIGESNEAIGGHGVLICWYDKIGPGIQNSWDLSWGVNGFGRMTWKQFDDQFIYAVVLE